ncbi:hypothetical protein ABZV29_22420 [Streptomyces sp. NPDC005236]|uniref:hypothetical protein n=1 Tax=Streptomyces sp. NPDC005236 TaxID=3157028 RepID=UPI0033BEBC6C
MLGEGVRAGGGSFEPLTPERHRTGREVAAPVITSEPNLGLCFVFCPGRGASGEVPDAIRTVDDRSKFARASWRHGLHHGVEEGPGFDGVAAAVPVHVAALVVKPQLALGTVDVVSPQTHRGADVSWLKIVAGVFETEDLGQCTRGQSVDVR